MESNVIEFPIKSSYDPNALDEIESIEIVRQAKFILENAKSEVTLTQKGFLPRKLTQNFWEVFLKPKGGFHSFKPNREEDCRELYRLNFLLSESGYVTRGKGKLKRSRKAEKILAASDVSTLYCDLFTAMLEAYNWGHDDRYGFLDDDYESIQMAATGLLRWIASKRPPFVSPEQMFRESFHFETRPSSHLPIEEQIFLHEQPIRCLQTRFFDRFCIPFGLLVVSSEDEDLGNGKISQMYAPTKFLLDRLFLLLES